MPKNTEISTTSYEEMKSKWKAEEQWIKSHPVRGWFIELYKSIRGFFYRLPDVPYNIKWYILRIYQRSSRGWADSDAWGFDCYLARVIKEGCEWLRKNKHGCPCIEGYDSQTDEGFDAMCKEWDRILENIAWTFAIAEKINDYNWRYPSGEYFTDEEVISGQKFCNEMKKDYPNEDYHVMTREEVVRYRQGWVYFQQYFFNLWD